MLLTMCSMCEHFSSSLQALTLPQDFIGGCWNCCGVQEMSSLHQQITLTVVPQPTVDPGF